ncbi:phosphatidylserine decarboxylase family protein [Lewinellaceae bacterium SD302]|nr:phosphatidylserine decarboxylase family protein [Lewinellaceae bacterium SD302]
MKAPLRIHQEGRSLLFVLLLLMTGLNFGVYQYFPNAIWLSIGVSILLFLLILQFFRNPLRIIPQEDDGLVYAPADGKVVVIEETEESEYFHDRRLQVSIFMSPVNVHVNRSPVSGLVKYYRYHPGKYLVAWHPKSSSENERTTTVIQTSGNTEILMRQIAGALARRIKNYLTEGQRVEQGVDIGFIKFGSRVDLFFPLGTDLKVNLGDKVKGNKTVVAELE